MKRVAHVLDGVGFTLAVCISSVSDFIQYLITNWRRRVQAN